MANRVVDNLDALVGIAVKIAAARPHAIPIVFFRFGFYRFAADSGDRVVASYRGHGDPALVGYSRLHGFWCGTGNGAAADLCRARSMLFSMPRPPGALCPVDADGPPS